MELPVGYHDLVASAQDYVSNRRVRRNASDGRGGSIDPEYFVVDCDEFTALLKTGPAFVRAADDSVASLFDYLVAELWALQDECQDPETQLVRIAVDAEKVSVCEPNWLNAA